MEFEGRGLRDSKNLRSYICSIYVFHCAMVMSSLCPEKTGRQGRHLNESFIFPVLLIWPHATFIVAERDGNVSCVCFMVEMDTNRLISVVFVLCIG
jgi:hypothetical protein